MTNKPKASGDLDPEMLAAYIDQRLPPDERAAVEAQLATDPDSYELLVELIHANEALKDAAPAADPAVAPKERPEEQATVVPLVPKPARTRTWAIAGGVLAVAAALVLIVRLQPELLPWLRGGEATDPQLAKLVAAVGEERYIEARLTGGFKYGPLRSVTRSGATIANLSLTAAAGELQKKVSEDPSAQNLQRWGIAQLQLGLSDDAIQTLERALLLEADSAVIQSDLAAAFLFRAATRGSVEDLPKALAAAERAITSNPTLAEAWFNRALAIESIGLRSEAKQAWQDYLDHEPSPDSPWIVEARLHLDRLDVVPPVSRDDRTFDLNGWLGSQAASALDGEGLASGVLAGLQPVTASAIAGGDRFPSAVATFVVSRPVVAAAVFVRLRAAANASRNDKFELAAALAEEATVLAQGVSVVRFAGVHHLLTNAFLQGHFSQIEAMASRLIPTAQELGFPRLEATLLGRLGAAHYSRGEFEVARRLHERALAIWLAVGDAGGAASSRIVLAETHRILGDRDQAWRQYLEALRSPSLAASAVRQHTLLISAALGALNDGRPEVARAFASEAARHAEVVQIAGFGAESNYVLARAADGLANPGEAARYLDRSVEHLSKVSDPGLHMRLEAELKLTAALLADSSGDGAESFAAAKASLELYRRLGTSHREVRLLTLQAAAQRDLGDSRHAETLLDESIAHVERLMSHVTADTVRLTFADDVWTPFAEMAELQVSIGDADRALGYLHRGLGIGLRQPIAAAQAKASVLDPRVTRLTYFASREQLLIWVRKASASSLIRVPIHESELSLQVDHLSRLLSSEARGAALERAAQDVARSLVWPITSHLADADHLLVVADPVLQRVPFALLPVAQGSNRLLVQIFDLTLCAAADTCAVEAPRHKPITARALYASGATGGAAALPTAQREAGLSGASYRDGRSSPATGEAFLAALADAEVVHYAGHAFLNDERPWLSSLSLSDGAETFRASLHELLPTRIGARVVVLGACRTVGGAPRRGQGVVGIAAEFLKRGAEEVVATLWDVDDSGVSPLLIALHSELAKGKAASAALRTVQEAAISAGVSPRHWASLVTIQS